MIDINDHYQIMTNQHKNLFNLSYSQCLLQSNNISHNKIKIKNLKIKKIKTVKINIKIEYKYIQSNIFTVSAAYCFKSFCHISFQTKRLKKTFLPVGDLGLFLFHPAGE